MRNASPFFGAYLIYKEARPLTHKRVKSYLKITAFFFTIAAFTFCFLICILLNPSLPKSKFNVIHTLYLIFTLRRTEALIGALLFINQDFFSKDE